MRRREGRGNREIAPDEIFLDAENRGDFDRARFEGRLERPLSRPTYLALALALALALLALLARAGDLALLQGRALAERSAGNSLAETALFAPRGVITDREGVILADNTEGENGLVMRRYPYPELGTVIGYVSLPKRDASGNYYDTAERGLAGLEARYDELLAGENGRLLVETDATGRVRSQGALVPPAPGRTLVTTLDAELERTLAEAISGTVRRVGFIAGAGVILEADTGAVRAIVSYPSYDPNVMTAGGPAEEIARYNNEPGRPYLDHAIAGVYTPGSIVKPFIAAGGLTDGLITPATVIDDTGVLVVPNPYRPGESFRYTGWRALGPVDVRKAIAWSSDIFFYTLGGGFGGQRGLGIDRLGYWYRAFGFASTTGIDLSGEEAGLIPTPAWKEATFDEPWYLGDTYFTAIGQYSTQITPIAAARGAAALANGGRLVTPFVVSDASQSAARVPVGEETLRVVREGMRQAVTGVLAGALNLPYVSVAAKTGTAQVGARNQFDNSWVIGFFPYEHPRYAFAVVLERGPEGSGEQAVNVMRDLFAALHEAGSAYAGGSASTSAALAR